MRRPSLANASLVIAASYVVSNLAGFLARALINARFGAGIEQDAFRAAFNIPDLLFNLLAGGALASAFIPTYTGRLAKGERGLAWQLARRVALLVFVVIGALAALAALFAPALIAQFIAPGLPAEGQALTASLMRVMLLSTVIFSVSGLLMGILQSNGRFLAPAIAPALYNLGQIVGALLLTQSFGIHGLAYGVVLGALAHMVVQIPALSSEFGVRSSESRVPSPEPGQPNTLSAEPAMSHSELGTRNSELRTDIVYILRVMPLRMLGSGAVYVNNIVRDNLATRVGAGAVSALNSAFATMILPQAVIAQAISTALFPTISAHAARGDRREFARTLTQAINVIIALSLPAAAGLVVLGEPIIALLFQRGQFDALASRQAGLALAMYGVGLVGHCVLEIVTRAFYALKDNKPPVLFGVASVVLNIALSFVLLPVFATVTPAYFAALALANAIATTLETVALFVVLLRRYPEIALRGTFVEFAKSALGAGAMSAAVLLWLNTMGAGALSTLGALLIGGVVYLAAAIAQKSALLGLVRR